MSRMESFPCACAFAKSVNDRSPFNFPRIGMADTVLYRGYWINRHTTTGRTAVIMRIGEGPLHPEARQCCFEWFDQKARPTNSPEREE
ncbi:hypothetical protein GCM10011360_18010 [Primorskyibacter flagellatus]|uniref:Uncharacterized protein n=1 Tax=Primorskyibacter flagellatus TaxID=1387277 RepID=A0A917A661_9RHOB|nr:hypothetical protein GCM10011360_18010 [Primorskyibacter flagellatus]